LILLITAFVADATSIGIIILTVTINLIFDDDKTWVKLSICTIDRIFEIECAFVIINIIITVSL